MVVLLGVIVWHHTRGNIWECAKEVVRQHLLCNVFGYLLNLFENISQKCITWPSVNEHDGIFWYPSEVHLNCCSQTKGAGVNFAWLKAKASAANGGACCLEHGDYLLWWFLLQFAMASNWTYWSVLFCTRICSIQLMSHANCKTGQSVATSVHPWITVSCLWSFFCISNVTAWLLASSKLSDGIERRCLSLENICKHNSFVHFISLQGTFGYLQEQHANKAVLIVSCKMALSKSVTCLFASSSRAANVRAFCWTCSGSLLLKAQNCLAKRMLSFWLTSVVGFCLPFAQKACTTCEMVPWTILSARTLKHSPKNLPCLTAMAKAPSNMRIYTCWESLSMKRLLHLTDAQYFVHLPKAWALLLCVVPITACS